jgi:hypothetical protein
MIQLIAVHEPTESQLAEWLMKREISFQQFSAAIAGVKNPELAIPPPPEKPSLFRRFLAWLKK